MKSLTSLISLALPALFVGPLVAQPGVKVPLDWEQFPEGRIMDDEFDLSAGVNIITFKGNPGAGSTGITGAGQGVGYSVLYDSTDVGGGADPDLEGPPWDAGNAEFFIAGNLIIVQENGPTAGEITAGQLSTNAPDDNSGGSILFEYDTPQEAMTFYWVDMDDANDGEVVFIDTTTTPDTSIVVEFADLINPASQFYDPGVEFGDASFDFIDEISVQELTAFSGTPITSFNYVRFNMIGSGSVAFMETDPLWDSSIGDFVWHDLNGDGRQDNGEPGIGRVSVDLHIDDGDGTPELDDGIGAPGPGEQDTLFRRIFTDENGHYLMPGLPPGSYWVSVSDVDNVIHGAQTNLVPDPLLINLAADEVYDEADFGFDQDGGSIGDFVWNDADGDGNQDVGEEGIAFVTLRLWRNLNNGGDDKDVLLATTITDANGAYSFDGLSGGSSEDYVVEVTDTRGILADGTYTTAGGNEQNANNLGATENRASIDFGINQVNGAIGDLIWNDEDDSNTQNGSEAGIPGVTVELWREENGSGDLDGSDTLIDIDVTDASGIYGFEGLPAGTYFVRVREELAPITNAPRSTAGVASPRSVTLGTNTVNNAIDFGYLLKSRVGDFVWDDLDGDGNQDVGEPGIPGVTLDLYNDVNNNDAFDAGDTLLGTTITDASGNYEFAGLDAGEYLVSVTDRDDVISGIGGRLSSGQNPIAVTVGTNVVIDTADFGFERYSTIGDRVWNDADADEQQDVGELGIPNVTVRLIRDDDGDGVIDGGEPVLETAATDANGRYEFDTLLSGSYIVDVTDTNGVLNGASTTNNDPYPLYLQPAERRTEVDFGYQQGTGVIGDLIWSDDDGDGNVDGGEAGIQNVTVRLYIDTDNSNSLTAGDQLVAVDTTDANGNYSFTGLAAEDYLIDVTDENSVLDDFQLSSPGSEPVLTNLTNGETDNSLDFGYEPVGTIGDFVFKDVNANNAFDPGEPGLANITLELVTDLNNNGAVDGADAVVATTATNSSGNYLFQDVPAGNYTVRVTDTNNLLAGASLNVGTDPADADITAGQNRLDVDFGYDPGTGEIGDRVFEDSNTNGVDNGEPGVALVTVELWRDFDSSGTVTGGDFLVSTTETNGTGNYLFDDLGLQDYVVVLTDTRGVLGGATPTTALSQAASLSGASPTDLTLDFGYTLATGSIGNLVYNDANASGVPDVGETGYSNVTVVLYRDLDGDGAVDPGEPIVQTDTTDGSGNYLFDNLGPDNYLVVVTDDNNVLTGLINTAFQSPFPVALTAGETFGAADFGYASCPPYVTVNLRYRITMDASFDNGESVEARLYLNGTQYGIGANNYIDILQGQNGSGDTTDTGWQQATIEIPGLSVQNYDLGLRGFVNQANQGSEDAFVFFDDVEVLVNGRRLFFADFNSDTNDFDYTDISSGGDVDGNNSGNDGFSGQGLEIAITGQGNNIMGAYEREIGVSPRNCTLGDRVWQDDNKSTFIESGEPGLGNVTVDLYVDNNLDGVINAGDTFIGQRTTDANGFYLFNCLGQGQYLTTVTDANNELTGLFLTNTTLPRTTYLENNETALTEDFGYSSNPITLATIDSLEVLLVDGQPEVHWTTSKELTTIGWHLREGYRLQSQALMGNRLSTTILPADGTPFSGASYVLRDTRPIDGSETDRVFWLEEILPSGDSLFHGPLTLTLRTATSVEDWQLF